jgi:hypothetical protein
MHKKTYTAIIERVTKLLLVPLDKKGVWSGIQKPTLLLNVCVCMRACTHTHTHSEPHEIFWFSRPHVHPEFFNWLGWGGGEVRADGQTLRLHMFYV